MCSTIFFVYVCIWGEEAMSMCMCVGEEACMYYSSYYSCMTVKERGGRRKAKCINNVTMGGRRQTCMWEGICAYSMYVYNISNMTTCVHMCVYGMCHMYILHVY